jgi:effector-binding domain-containing protein
VRRERFDSAMTMGLRHESSGGDLAYAELGSYIARQELAVGPRIREYYHRDHTHTTDHTQWRTEVAWPIIDVLTPKA